DATDAAPHDDVSDDTSVLADEVSQNDVDEDDAGKRDETQDATDAAPQDDVSDDTSVLADEVSQNDADEDDADKRDETQDATDAAPQDDVSEDISVPADAIPQDDTIAPALNETEPSDDDDRTITLDAADLMGADQIDALFDDDDAEIVEIDEIIELDDTAGERVQQYTTPPAIPPAVLSDDHQDSADEDSGKDNETEDTSDAVDGMSDADTAVQDPADVASHSDQAQNAHVPDEVLNAAESKSLDTAKNENDDEAPNAETPSGLDKISTQSNVQPKDEGQSKPKLKLNLKRTTATSSGMKKLNLNLKKKSPDSE
ncbi:MAG: hypothetical protein CMH52_02925, partial [Myxococcales bacterium]|nr:hypothetical protein [Myxococcales bacterium]